jgi:hypothetical protein
MSEADDEKAFERDRNRPAVDKNKYPKPDEDTFDDFSRTKEIIKKKSGRDPYGDINKSKKPPKNSCP